jgi:hypothetical protein
MLPCVAPIGTAPVDAWSAGPVGTRVARSGWVCGIGCCALDVPVAAAPAWAASWALCCRLCVIGSVCVSSIPPPTLCFPPTAAPAAWPPPLLSAALRRCSSRARASSSARRRSICSRSAFCRASRSARSRMIILGPLMPCDGDPVCCGGAVGRVAAAPLPLVLAGPPAPAKRSAMEAFSSIRSGLKALGCLSASSRAQRIALCVPLEIRTTR